MDNTIDDKVEVFVKSASMPSKKTDYNIDTESKQLYIRAVNR